MKTYKPKRYWASTLALSVILIALIISFVNLFMMNDILNNSVLILLIIGVALNIKSLIYQGDKWYRAYMLTSYECDLIKHSYKSMGAYIYEMEIPELKDLPLRIENEFKDIKIKKRWYTERIKMTKQEIQDLKERDLI